MGTGVIRVVKELAADLAIHPGTSTTIALRSALRERLALRGYGLRSDELAEEWIDKLDIELETALCSFDTIGVPRPMVPSENARSVMLTYRHKNYPAHLDGAGVNEVYFKMLATIEDCAPRELLIISSCVLYSAGCDPILITEGGDGGVDCVGLIPGGPLRSVCLFIQAKTCNASVSKGVVQAEYVKFCDMQEQPQHHLNRYLAALGRPTSRDGQSLCYAIFASNEFQEPAIQYAATKHFIVRSKRQLAYLLSRSFSESDYLKVKAALDPPTRNLQRNIATDIAQTLVA
jgi:hypothetical protein